ncbi:hypothetical protein QFZ70_002989 [Arthrobacter sp. V1I9]|nr:hypothetical protein [Arthrobacter sp. V1I9]MDQ0870516.1 hypothetical protein [Arthrobacter sp. V1I9]
MNTRRSLAVVTGGVRGVVMKGYIGGFNLRQGKSKDRRYKWLND